MRKRFKEGKMVSDWEKGRKNFCEERGITIEEMEEKREEGEACLGEVERKDKEKQRKERWERIRKSRYNRWYKEVKGERIPKYLKKGWGESKWKEWRGSGWETK